MKYLIVLLAIFQTLCISVFSQENQYIDLFKKHPALLSSFASLANERGETKIVFQRSDLLEYFVSNQMNFEGTKLQINKTPIEILDPIKSGNEIPDLYKRNVKMPLIIYQWEVTVENAGDYLVCANFALSAEGFLNQERTVVLNQGIVSICDSGFPKVKLNKGKNIFILRGLSTSSRVLKVYGLPALEKIQVELLKKLNSNTKEDVNWVLNDFLPYLATLKTNCGPQIVSILKDIMKKNNFNKESLVWVQILKIIQSCGSDLDSFAIEEFIWNDYREYYFLVNTKDVKSDALNSFIYNNQIARTKFLEQLIYNGKVEVEKKYFEICEKFFENSDDIKDKQKCIAKFYADRYIFYYRFGRVKDAYDLHKITEEKIKPFPNDFKYVHYTMQNFRDALLVREEDIISLNSFDEVKAQSILDVIENYDGKEEGLVKAYSIFNVLNKNLIKANSTIHSLPSFFRMASEHNPKFNADFKKFCAVKAETQINKAKDSRDIKLLNEVLEQYDGILSLPDIRSILIDEYFLRGGLFQAYDQMQLLTQQNPELLNKMINRRMMVEEISEKIIHSIPNLSADQLSTSVIIKGKQTSIEKAYIANKVVNKNIGPGKFLKAITLPPVHIQYRSHPYIDQVQPIEPLFTSERIIINGGSYLINYSVKENNVTWSYHSNNEFKKDTEPGPFQKQFYTELNANRLFMMTNKDNSSQKTLKSFDLSGQLLFDIAERNESLDEEPLCTPIVHEGKAFCISYSNNETINAIHFSTFDAQTGTFINKVPLTSIPEKVLDYNAYPFPRRWNTFTHDKHFFREGSSIYGFSGTGVVFKANSSTGCIDWAKGVAKSSFYHNNDMDFEYGYAPSGFIKVFGNVLVTLTPEIQQLTGWDKNTGVQLWKSRYLRAMYLHERNNNEAIYFSDFTINDETNLYRINSKTGGIDWQVSVRGARVTGEGVVVGKKIFVPCQNSIFIYEKDTGEFLGKNDLPFTAVKIRSDENLFTIFSNQTCYIFNLDGNWEKDKIVSFENINATSLYQEPVNVTESSFHFNNLCTEITLKIPETIFAGTDYWKRTKISKTIKPFHYTINALGHLALFRESFKTNNGQYMAPEILWYAHYDSFFIDKESLWVFEKNIIYEYDLFTRVLKRSINTNARVNPINDRRDKVPAIISVSESYIAVQCVGNSIRIFDKKTLKLFNEIYSPVMKTICLSDQYLITMTFNSIVRCYSFAQNNAEIWSAGHNNRADVVLENDTLVFSKYSDASTVLIDIKSGKQKIVVKPVNGFIYTMNNWILNSKWFFAYNMLYDTVTGEIHPKVRECYSVNGGGYIGFFKQYGKDGLYIHDGKEIPFSTRCNRDHNNFAVTALRKNNLLFIATPWFLETFELKNDELILVEAVRLNSGYVGEGQWPGDMQFKFLDNSILVAKNDEMYFLKNHDFPFKTESIESFRVENVKQTDWPYSELYPDIECNSENWVSCSGNLPARKILYSAFSDNRSAYLKFVISPNTRKGSRDIIYISGNGNGAMIGKGHVALRWEPDLWDKCQVSPNLNQKVKSWKENDLNGNICLFIKISLDVAFMPEAKRTLSDFHIEFRQITNGKLEGYYRIGGPYYNTRNFLPWLNYLNNESDLLSDYRLRAKFYENKINFYPQGEDFVFWLRDRRKIYGTADNIRLLEGMLKSNSNYFCSVNILTGLLIEEIQRLRELRNYKNEIDNDFYNGIIEIQKRLIKKAADLGVNESWAKYALTVFTSEIYPYRTDLNDYFSGKSILGLVIKSTNKILFNQMYSEKYNYLTPNINHPYLEFCFPGLLAGFPKGGSVESISLIGPNNEKVGIGSIKKMTPNSTSDICTQDGKFLKPELKWMYINKYNKGENFEPEPRKYYFDDKVYSCFMPPRTSINYVILPIVDTVVPDALKDNGQTEDSMMGCLEMLTDDNKNGGMILDDILALKNTKDEKDLKIIYGKFIHNLKNNPRSCYHSLRFIYSRHANQKQAFDFMIDIMKEAKLTSTAPRMFFLEYNNIFLNKSVFSYMGPVDKPLVEKVESNLKSGYIYKSENGEFQFQDSLLNKKGGTIYLAAKINAIEKTRAYLVVNTPATSAINFTVVLNEKTLVDNSMFSNIGVHFSQVLSLTSGENILLIKLIGASETEWHKSISLIIGDNYGAPLKGVTFSPFK